MRRLGFLKLLFGVAILIFRLLLLFIQEVYQKVEYLLGCFTSHVETGSNGYDEALRLVSKSNTRQQFPGIQPSEEL